MTKEFVQTSRLKTIGIWTVSILIGLSFVMSGAGKLASSAGTAKLFEHFGYPAWFGTVIGVVEILGGIGLFIPRSAKFAAGILGVVMIGAVVSHIRVDELPRALFVAVLLGILGLIGVVRWKENE